MAIIEFYAFETSKANETAKKNFRKLASNRLERFIYDALGYSKADKWRYFTDRASILQDSSPDGYFIIFKEMNGLIVDLINTDLPVNDKTVPDISVGTLWSKHWKDNEVESKLGARKRLEHNYPDYYPQSVSNPQHPWAYPDETLPEFRRCLCKFIF